jgi:two-component system, cell cycle sensor histidine kinase and response regulator CckA
VYGIVKQNEGAVHAYSTPGTGTMFRIYLHRIRAEVPEPVRIPAEIPQSGAETVLIVEDEEQILKLAKMILESRGYTVLTAETPGDACLLCERHAGDIHLLLSDVVMPTMNGKELQMHIETLRPGIRTLFMSGYTSDIIANRGISDQGANFLPKPFTIEMLVERVRLVLDLPSAGA